MRNRLQSERPYQLQSRLRRRQANSLSWRVALAMLVGLGLFGAGYALGSTRPARPAHAQTGTPQDLEVLFAPFWEAWRLVHLDFVDQPLDDTLLMQGAIRGMVDALDDRHTAYMNPETFELFDDDLDGQFEGIGAEVDRDDDGHFIIIAPLDGSPAMAAGLLPGDELVAVDGLPVRDLDQADVLGKVRGPAGTPVTLTIRRSGRPGAFDVDIVRDVIVIEDVTWRMVEDDIAYVRLAQFSITADQNLHASLSEVMALQPRGMILDLRGNPGGLLDVSVDITGEFIASGPLLVERWGDGRERVYEASGVGLATEIPLVVLVDEGSASASEVLAAAIQSHERGTVVGQPTFGKGTVQNWHALNDGSGLRVTVARWLSPDGIWVDGSGVQPDVLVTSPDFRPQDLEQDVQLNAAIDILQGKTLWPSWPLPWLDRVSPGPGL